MSIVKELDLGNSDFKSLMDNDNYFVDKSLFIRDIIKAQKQVLLLPRPRRFGKTLNLSMLRYFFDINETNNEQLFMHLKIWQTENEIKERCGKYPVIYLSFKDAKHDTWEDTLTHIKIEISRVFREHDYLLKSDIISETEKEEYKRILNLSAQNVFFQVSINQLSNLLHRYFKQKVVILVDEYDTPIQAGYKKFYDEVISFMRNLLSGAFKDNNYLYRGVITGILRVSRESIFTGLNNISIYSVLDNEFSSHFGFTKNEVDQISADFGVTTDYDQIKKWYNGYRFGKTEEIHNPWSVLNFVLSFESGFKPYWVNSSSNELIKERLKERDSNYTREQLLKLINDETIDKEIDENFVFPDLDTDKELLWSLLTFSGYLTTEKKLSVNEYSLRIPNYEIRFAFKNIILKWLSVDLNIRKTVLVDTAKYLINNQLDKFEKGFRQIIGDTFSYFDLNGEPENVYHSYVLGLLAIIGDEYIIRSNRESGDGRYDILLIPHDKTRFGIVIEIKQMVKSDKDSEIDLKEKINKKINEALSQINENEYFKELIDHHIENIIKLPIIFVGKTPYVLPIK